MLRTTFLIVKVCIFFTIVGYGQSEKETESPKKREKNFVFLPAVIYSPESGLTIGSLNSLVFDMAKGDTLARMSQLSLFGAFTTQNEFLFGTRYTIFTEGERWRLNGRTVYYRDIDRNFGVGNTPNARVGSLNTETNELTDVTNYLDFRANRLEIQFGAYRQLFPKFFLGGFLDFRNVWNYRPFNNRIVEDDFQNDINDVPVGSTTVGLGMGMAFDNRDNINNTQKGAFIEMRQLYFQSLWGSDYNFYSVFLEGRYFLKTTATQTLAMRFLTDQRYHSSSYLPLYSYAVIGGRDLVRGYFEGTYRDNHLLALEAEYRIPLKQDPNSKSWQFWKRLAVHVFASTAQVMDDWEALSGHRFRSSVGIGGRYVLNFQERLNVRVDVGYGLDRGATEDGRALNFYFFIGEAF